MKRNETLEFHRALTAGPLAGAHVAVPFQPSLQNINEAMDEADRILAAGGRVVSLREAMIAGVREHRSLRVVNG